MLIFNKNLAGVLKPAALFLLCLTATYMLADIAVPLDIHNAETHNAETHNAEIYTAKEAEGLDNSTFSDFKTASEKWNGYMMNDSVTFNRFDEKYIAVIIDDYGYGGDGTDEMLNIGIPITAAIMPGLERSAKDAEAYFNAGHDVILHLPMEPKSGKTSWLGPFALTSELSDEKVYENVRDGLESIKYAVGINNHMGSRIMENERVLSKVMDVCSEKDLIYVDSKTTQNSVGKKLASERSIDFFERDIFLDEIKSVENTRKQMLKAAETADKKGYAIVIGHVGTAGGKTTVDGIKSVVPELRDRGYSFVTISELNLYEALSKIN